MPYYSETSKQRLSTCHPDLQRLFGVVIKHRDCTIIEGRRSDERQNALYREGLTNARAGQSAHNHDPSFAVDVMPYHPTKPHIRWDDSDTTIEFANFVLGVAAGLGIALEWGGHWKAIIDCPHYELTDA